MNVLTKPPAPPVSTPATGTSATRPVTDATPTPSNAVTPVSIPVPTTLAPATFAEVVEFAAIAARSQFVPASYRNRPEDILLAVQLGHEVGLRPMQALQNVAVINGRPALWGDAMPGLCKASGVFEDLVETFEHENDPNALTAVCTAKRRGSSPVTARFSVQDAKRAGLWGKPIWQTYPRRMLQMRARSFALRDCFPDVLKGLIAIEEARDLPAPSERVPDRITIDAAPEPPPAPSPPTPSVSAPAAPDEAMSDATVADPPFDDPAAPPDGIYRLKTKQGVTTFQTREEWLACWAKVVRACKSADALDKLQAARATNATHIAAVAAIDPEPAATLVAELDRALAAPSRPS